MGEGLHRCVGACVLAVGMSASVLTGSAVAAADTETTSPTTSAVSATKLKAAAAEKNSPRRTDKGDSDSPTRDDTTKTDSETSETETATSDETSGEAQDPPAAADEPDVDDPEVEVADEAETPERTGTETAKYAHATGTEEKRVAESVEAERDAGVDIHTGVGTPEADVDAEAVPARPASRTAPLVAIVSPPESTTAEESSQADVAAVDALAGATVTVSAARPTRPTIVNLIGSLFFGLLNLVVRVFEGPPAVPAGSTVRVSRAPLEIDCGDGYTVDADWYYPTEGEPEGLILFGHGFPARAGLYNGTAADLAQRTNSIVVAPSISSNIFACDGCHLSSEQMHAAVARLFLGDRTALLASAEHALGSTDLPRNFVLVGHSGGAQLVAGAGGFYELYGGTDLAGVIMLDGAEVGVTHIARDIGRIPLEIPVYNISAEPGSLNNFGSMSTVFDAIRPGLFSGVQLVGGTHSDTFQTANPFAQFVVYLMTGFPREGNVEAGQLLMSGWIDDMFAGNRNEGIYGTPGSVIDIPTSSGHPQARVLPAPVYTLSFFDQISRWFTESLGLIDVDYCAAPVPDGPVQTMSTRQCTATV